VRHRYTLFGSQGYKKAENGRLPPLDRHDTGCKGRNMREITAGGVLARRKGSLKVSAFGRHPAKSL